MLLELWEFDAMITSLGSLFWWQTLLPVKNFYLMSSVNFPWCIPLPHVLLLVTREISNPSLSTTSFEQVLDYDPSAFSSPRCTNEVTSAAFHKSFPHSLLPSLCFFSAHTLRVWCKFYIEASKTACSTQCEATAVQSGTISSLKWVVLLCLMHPRTLCGPFWLPGAHIQLVIDQAPQISVLLSNLWKSTAPYCNIIIKFNVGSAPASR